jgi:uncharacterized protein (UPF0276 family)
MQVEQVADRACAVGLAYCGYIPELLKRSPDVVDYVEIPFEMLIVSEDALGSVGDTPVVLHCASLSLAGNVPIPDDLRTRLEYIVARTRTPWVGEHLAFVRAQVPEGEPSMADAVILDAKTGAYNVGYTVSPQYSPVVLDRLQSALAEAEERLMVPVLLENGPLYVHLPGSTMEQAAFIRKLCDQRSETRLLLDLSHLEITAQNSGRDVFDLFAEFPVERVVEVHLSGHSDQVGMYWDDHAQRAPEKLFHLLEALLERVTPRAITLEYNWDSNFPLAGVYEDLDRVRKIVGDARP